MFWPFKCFLGDFVCLALLKRDEKGLLQRMVCFCWLFIQIPKDMRVGARWDGWMKGEVVEAVFVLVWGKGFLSRKPC